jgi:flagellar biosynthesis protein FliR
VIDLDHIAVFVLTLTRFGAWVLATPMLGRGISAAGRLAFALAGALFVTPLVAPSAQLPDGAGELVVLGAGQVLVGFILGWITGLVLSAFEAAGAAVDLFSGFAASVLLDPMTGRSVSVLSRFFSVIFTTLLFATGAHRTMVAGVVRSFDAVPLGQFPVLGADSPAGAGNAMAAMLLAALEIAAPVLGALFLTEVAIAVAARFAPQSNLFIVGLPLKVLVTLLTLGVMLVFLPGYVDLMVDQSVRIGTRMLG